MAQPVFDFPDVWTEADLDLLPDDGHRYEILDGSLVVTPAPGGAHQGIGVELIVAVRAAAPAGWRILHEIGLRVPGGNFEPDLVVLRPGVNHRVAWQDAENVALVVEIESKSTSTFDRTSKAFKYAEAGIPSYWRILRDGTVVVSELVGDTYEVVKTVEPGTTWTARQPFPVKLSPDDLIA